MSDYYVKNREMYIERAKANYRKRKEKDPEFWKRLKPLTEEDRKQDEEQMICIMRQIKEQREADQKIKTPEKKMDLKCFLSY